MTLQASLKPLPGVPASLLGESPMWHPDQGALWWCDIPGHKLNRWHAASQAHQQWAFESDVACCAPMQGGSILLAMRDGLWRFDLATGQRERLAVAVLTLPVLHSSFKNTGD